MHYVFIMNIYNVRNLSSIIKSFANLLLSGFVTQSNHGAGTDINLLWNEFRRLPMSIWNWIFHYFTVSNQVSHHCNFGLHMGCIYGVYDQWLSINVFSDILMCIIIVFKIYLFTNLCYCTINISTQFHKTPESGWFSVSTFPV